MEQALQISYRDFPKSEALDAVIREKAGKLDKYYEKIMACRVVVEQPHHHKHQGNLFHISIELSVPGKELVVKRDSPRNQAHEDAYVTVNDAFDAMRRQLQEFARRQRGDVKHHEERPKVDAAERSE